MCLWHASGQEASTTTITTTTTTTTTAATAAATSETTTTTTTAVNETGNGNLKCAESFCLPASYDKLEVPFDENGLVKVSGINFHKTSSADFIKIKLCLTNNFELPLLVSYSYRHIPIEPWSGRL